MNSPSGSQPSTLNSQPSADCITAPEIFGIYLIAELLHAGHHLREALQYLDSARLTQTHFLRRRLTATFAEVGDLRRAIARETESEDVFAHAIIEPAPHQLPPILQMCELFIGVLKLPADEIARQITNPRFAHREAAQTLLHLQQQLQRTEPAEPLTTTERSAA